MPTLFELAIKQGTEPFDDEEELEFSRCNY
jgi:hypothetical protein